MATFRVLLPALVVICVSTTTGQLNIFQTADIIAAHGYPSETHHVTTKDGYILEMHRIPRGKGQAPGDRPVVFLMHGLLAASNSYIWLGPELSPAYNIADGGFDVWLGNARGNRNSRAHTTLNPDDANEKLEFFDFSFEEIATRDLPAMIDYVLNQTGHKKLHYIGHSQGATTFLVLNSMLPEYNDKIQSAHLMGGVGYQEYFPDPYLAGIALFADVIYKLGVRTGSVELYPPPGSTYAVQADDVLNLCTGDEKTAFLCELAGVKHLMGAGTHTNDLDSIFDNDEPAGAALKQVAHFGQNVRDKSFRRWSYGILQNLIVYGTRNPPEYDLSRITIKTTMHYTIGDNLLDEKDVLAMAKVMPSTSVRKVARDTFSHVDFVFANDAKELVTDYIIQALRRDSDLPSL